MGVVTCCSMTLCEPLSYPAVILLPYKMVVSIRKIVYFRVRYTTTPTQAHRLVRVSRLHFYTCKCTTMLVS